MRWTLLAAGMCCLGFSFISWRAVEQTKTSDPDVLVSARFKDVKLRHPGSGPLKDLEAPLLELIDLYRSHRDEEQHLRKFIARSYLSFGLLCMVFSFPKRSHKAAQLKLDGRFS